MKKSVMAGLALWFWGAVALAQPLVPPLPTGLVVDQVGVLTPQERQALEQRLRAIEDSQRAQVAIFVAADTGGETLAAHGLRVAESWQLGRAGRNDGLLILVIPSPGAARIEVGYGLEGSITDALASVWLDELLPAMKRKEYAGGLHRLLDRIEAALPAAPASAGEPLTVLDAHPEWKLSFVLAIFSPFALFPMFLRRGGGAVSGVLLALFAGGAGWALWGEMGGVAAAMVALPLPPLWALNRYGPDGLSPRRRLLRGVANLLAVALFFAFITLFVGVGLQVTGTQELWVAPIFAGLMATGLAVFLFPGKPAHYLMLGLRSAMHFVFLLVVAWVAFGPFIPHPAREALTAAGAITALTALGFWRERREAASGGGATRWSLWCFGLAVLLALPLALLALVGATLGEELQAQLTLAAAGGGSLTGTLWLAVRVGLAGAVKAGLGGRFGGGGAGRLG